MKKIRELNDEKDDFTNEEHNPLYVKQDEDNILLEQPKLTEDQELRHQEKEIRKLESRELLVHD